MYLKNVDPTTKIKYLAAFVLSLIFVFSVASQAAEEKDIVVYFPFDEGAGNTTKDLSANGFVGNLEGAKWTDGKIGSALEFNGEGAKVLVDPIEDPLEQFSIELWFRPAKKLKAGDGRQDIIYRAPGGGGCPHITFDREGNGTIGFYTRVRLDGDRENIEVFSNRSTWDARWYHVVGTQSMTKIAIYIDGELANEMDTPVKGPAVADYGEIGASIGGASNFFEGTLDELRIWNVSLSADEVKMLFNGTHPVMSVEPKSKLSTVWGKLKVAESLER